MKENESNRDNGIMLKPLSSAAKGSPASAIRLSHTDISRGCSTWHGLMMKFDKAGGQAEKFDGDLMVQW